MCFGCRIDDLVNGLHGKIKRHEFALCHSNQLWLDCKPKVGRLTTGCKPARAAPTVRPAKPDSVIGLSMTLLSPKRSNNPLVTLYLFGSISKETKIFQRHRSSMQADESIADICRQPEVKR